MVISGLAMLVRQQRIFLSQFAQERILEIGNSLLRRMQQKDAKIFQDELEAVSQGGKTANRALLGTIFIVAGEPLETVV